MARRSLSRWVCAFAFAMSSGCATGYQSVGFSGGYSETRLAENAFEVRFKGNGYTSAERVADFALLRSAEVAMENGYSYFVIVDSGEYFKTSSFTMPEQTTTQTTAHAFGNTVQAESKSSTTGGQTIHISKPRAVNTIVCFHERPETTDLVYDALVVVRSVREKYDLAPSSDGGE